MKEVWEGRGPAEHKCDLAGAYVVRCGFKNGYQKDMCLKEIELRAQNVVTI